MPLFDPEAARSVVVAIHLAAGRGSPSVTPRECELANLLSLALVEIERLREIGEIASRTMERMILRLAAERAERRERDQQEHHAPRHHE